MYPVESTALIIALKATGQPFDKRWIDWATEMIVAGFETPNLLMLAAEEEPFNQFRLHDITNHALTELGYDFSDKETAIKNYTAYLIECMQKRKVSTMTGLHILMKLCVSEDYPAYLYRFYLFWFAKDELRDLGVQFYIQEPGLDNIDIAIENYFATWKIENGYN